MICKIVINRIIALIFLSVISTANAGLISTANDSYIDDNTGLEWMDFSGTAGLSYNQVMGLISDGGQYEDWVTPTAAQVQALYNGNYSTYYSNFDIYSNLITGRAVNVSPTPGYFSVLNYSVFDSLFRVMGTDSTLPVLFYMYESAPGSLTYSHHINVRDFPSEDRVYVNNNSGLSANREAYARNFSTLLIKKTEAFAAPEPSTLAILALGMIGLASRRFKK